MAETKPRKKGAQQSAKRSTDKASKGFTDEEQAAIRERQELRAAASRGPRGELRTAPTTGPRPRWDRRSGRGVPA
jgi:hypothetical protein